MEQRGIAKLSEIVSLSVSIITLITLICGALFWFYQTNALPARVKKNEERIDKLQAQLIENNTKTDLIYQGIIEIRGVLLKG